MAPNRRMLSRESRREARFLLELIEMARLRIPPSHREPLQILAGLDSEKRFALLDCIEEHDAALAAGGKETSLSEAAGVGPEEATDILYMLLGIYESHASKTLTASDLVDTIGSDKKLSSAIVDQDKLETFFDRLFTLDSSLGLLSKAYRLRRRQANTLCTSEIFTDLRPAFSDPDEQPTAALIMHTLRIVYHEGQEVQEIFIGLKRSDLKDLSQVVERALRKDESLRKFTTRTDLTLLEPE